MLNRLRNRKLPEKKGGLFTELRVTMAVTAFIVGASFCIASDDWHKSNIFFYVNQLPIPWFVYGALLLVGGVFIIIERLRPIGFLVGAILYTFFAFTIWLAVIGGLHWFSYLHFPNNSVGSFYAACNATTIAVLYWSALKHSIYAQVDPERVAGVKQ